MKALPCCEILQFCSSDQSHLPCLRQPHDFALTFLASVTQLNQGIVMLDKLLTTLTVYQPQNATVAKLISVIGGSFGVITGLWKFLKWWRSRSIHASRLIKYLEG